VGVCDDLHMSDSALEGGQGPAADVPVRREADFAAALELADAGRREAEATAAAATARQAEWDARQAFVERAYAEIRHEALRAFAVTAAPSVLLQLMGALMVWFTLLGEIAGAQDDTKFVTVVASGTVLMLVPPFLVARSVKSARETTVAGTKAAAGESDTLSELQALNRASRAQLGAGPAA